MADSSLPPEGNSAHPTPDTPSYSEPPQARLWGVPVILWVLLAFVAFVIVLAVLGLLPNSVL